MINIMVIGPGHGSCELQESLQMHKRPDVPFDPSGIEGDVYDLNQFPSNQQNKEFRERTFGRYSLDTKKTIEENMKEYLGNLINSDQRTMLCGRICRLGKPFFARHKFDNSAFLIRHPLHAMASYLKHRHPEKVTTRFDGDINSEKCIRYYAKLWNDTVSDCLGGGLQSIRYEFATLDVNKIDDDEIKTAFKNWWINKRNKGIISNDAENLLRKLVEENYTRLYEEWDI
jgi:hypothetical protein